MSFGDLVGNEKGVKHPFVRCVDCISCMQKPTPIMVVFGRSEEDFPVKYSCYMKKTGIDDPDMPRICSSYECEQPEPEDEKREYCVTFTGRGHAVVRAKNEDQAAELAEESIEFCDFSDIDIEDVEANI